MIGEFSALDPCFQCCNILIEDAELRDPRSTSSVTLLEIPVLHSTPLSQCENMDPQSQRFRAQFVFYTIRSMKITDWSLKVPRYELGMREYTLLMMGRSGTLVTWHMSDLVDCVMMLMTSGISTPEFIIPHIGVSILHLRGIIK